MSSWTDRIGRREAATSPYPNGGRRWGAREDAEHLEFPPAVSKMIADRICVRRASPRPSPARHRGNTLWPRVIRRSIVVFDELRQSVKDIEFFGDPTVGEVRIGCTEPMAVGFVPAVIERINRQHPRVSFHVVQADFGTTLPELRARDIDLMIGRPAGPISDEDLDTQFLFNDRLFVLAGRQNRWTGRRKIKLAELIHEPWSLAPVGSISQSVMVAAFRRRRGHPASGCLGRRNPIAHPSAYDRTLYYYRD